MNQFNHLDHYLEKLVKTGPAGCGCAIARDGEVLFENYYGYANLENKIPVSGRSIFRQFSTTKVIVCTAAMMLYERGAFLLNDPYYEYFPEWRNTMTASTDEQGMVYIRPVRRPIQVKDCFTMAMGIGYDGEDYTHQQMKLVRKKLAHDKPDYTLQDDIRAMAEVPIAFDPGTRWLYGFGHEMVAGLIEVVSGMTVGEFLRKEIFVPLGMDSTGYRYFDDTRSRMVTAYQVSEDGIRIPIVGFLDGRHEPESRYEGGGTGLFSTIGDYLKFTQMLACGGVYQGERLLGRKTIDLIRTNQLNDEQMQDFSNPYLEGYGYGLGMRTMVHPSVTNTSLGEFGWTGAMGTYVSIDPAEKISLVYMHNLVPNRELEIHSRVRNIVYGAI